MDSPLSFTNISTWDNIKFAIVWIFVTWLFIRYYNYFKNLPPGPWGVPILGSLPFMKGAPHSWYLKKSEEYGDIFSLQMGSNLVVCIGTTKLMKEIFYRPDSTGRPQTPLNNLMGGLGIILSEGALWKKQRQFLHEKFRNLGVKVWPNQRFEKFIIMEVEEMLKEFENSNGRPMDPILALGRHTHNVICQLMMSFRFKENDEEFLMFNERITRGMKLFGSIHFGEHVKHYMKLPGKQAVLKEMQRNLEDISKFHLDRVVARREMRKNTIDYEPADLIDHYLENIERENDASGTTIFPNTNADSQIVQVMNDLFSAGMETVRTSLLWCLVLMLRVPAVAKRVRAELSKVVHAKQLVTLEHRTALPYVEAVIYETIRLVSVVPLGTTHVNTSPWHVENYTIPAGTHIIPLINKMNMDSDIYPEPRKFKPERFIRNGQFSLTENYMPFGVGQRMCLGTQLARMELFIFFANIMNHFELVNPAGQETPGLDGILGTTHAPLPFNVCFKHLDH